MLWKLLIPVERIEKHCQMSRILFYFFFGGGISNDSHSDSAATLGYHVDLRVPACLTVRNSRECIFKKVIKLRHSIYI